jgi:hypothetical protein
MRDANIRPSPVKMTRGEEHGNTCIPVQLSNILPDMPPCLRIQTDSRFVEKQDLRPMHKSACNFKPSFHAAGIGFHQFVGFLLKLDKAQHFRHTRTPL